MHRVWTRWIAQHAELEGGDGLREGIWVGMDEGMLGVNAKTMDPAPNQPETNLANIAPKGIQALDVTHFPSKTHLAKSLAILDPASKSPPPSCTLCSKHVPSSGASTLICPSTSCKSVTHLTCLATHFLATEKGRLNSPPKEASTSLLPTTGSCPSCHQPQHWRDLVLDLSLRMRGAKETAVLFKAPRKSKKAKQGAAAETSNDDEVDENEDPESDDEHILEHDDVNEEEEEDVWHQLSSSPVAGADPPAHAPASTGEKAVGPATITRSLPPREDVSRTSVSGERRTATETATAHAQPAKSRDVIEIEDSDLDDEILA